MDRWLVTGASGLLGSALCGHLLAAGCDVVGVRHREPVPDGAEEAALDLAEPFDAEALLRKTGATHVVHAAALTDVDRCEAAEASARRLHVHAAGALAGAARRRGARFVLISTDQLWADLSTPATEEVPPAPLNAYGRTKAAGERVVLDTNSGALVVRTNFFGAGTPRRRSASDRIVEALATGGRYRGFADVWFTPIGLPLLVPLLCTLTDRGVAGTLHLGGADRVSKLDFARRVAAHLGYPVESVEPGSVEAARLAAPRPAVMALDSGRAERLLGRRMPTLAASIEAVCGPPGDLTANLSPQARIRE
jgi:dTDP-4-dehydrorhamnose reductase